MHNIKYTTFQIFKFKCTNIQKMASDCPEQIKNWYGSVESKKKVNLSFINQQDN